MTDRVTERSKWSVNGALTNHYNDKVTVCMATVEPPEDNILQTYSAKLISQLENTKFSTFPAFPTFKRNIFLKE